jgi:trk system potassium uptake protein TrkA
MKQFAIIGLDTFGKRILEELIETGSEILIIDKDREVIEYYKDKVTSAFIADALNEEIIRKLIPDTIDAAIIDLGDAVEVSILVTNYLKKIGVKEIVAKAESNEHGEILTLVGATRVIFPNKEAAKRITPLLLSSFIFTYLPINEDFIIAEVKVPPKYVGKTLIEVNLRREHGLNVIAFRKEDSQDYSLYTPEHILQEDDVCVIAGREKDITTFAQIVIPENGKGWRNLFRRFFSRFNKPKEEKNGKKTNGG